MLNKGLSAGADEITRLRAEVERLTNDLAYARVGRELMADGLASSEEELLALRAERDQIIERCAKVCDGLDGLIEVISGGGMTRLDTAAHCAAAIRVLKDKQ